MGCWQASLQDTAPGSSETNCWADQTRFIAKGDPYDEFVVEPSQRTVEEEINKLLLSGRATREEMAVSLKRLQSEIHERKQTEERLRESEANYRFLAEHMHDVVWTVDLDLRTLYVSPSIEEALGFTPEEACEYACVGTAYPGIFRTGPQDIS